MDGSKLLALVLAACVAAVGDPSPAGGQCRLCETPTTSRDESLAGGDIKLELETSLNFDRLIVDGQGDGAAIIHPDGSQVAQGAVTQMSSRAMVGTVIVRGEPNRIVHVELPRQIDLYSLSGGRITFDDVSSDLPALPRLDTAGRLTFRFGGRLRVTGEGDGDYRGDLPIIVEYP